MSDPYNLQRFVEAQSRVYEQACAEVRRGRKAGHWMWFIFPQLKGLGRSETAIFYEIASQEEAKAYLAHETLGPRLRECSLLVSLVEDRAIDEIMVYPDDAKLRSSMALFAYVADDNEPFRQVIERHFQGKPDQRTLDLL